MSTFAVRYQTIGVRGTDIHVRTLKDKQQFSDPESAAKKLGISSATWPLFGVIWPSGKVLANHMLDVDIKHKRILEVGCGIGLGSLVLNHRQANITATDYHPEVESFLIENTRINNGRTIPFVRTGWADKITTLGLFDLIIGSDLLYDHNHAELLSLFINQHAKQHCEVIIVDPGRKQQARFSKSMVSLGYRHSQSRPENIDYLCEPFSGKILFYQR